MLHQWILAGLLVARVMSAAVQPTITVLQPQGLRFSVPDSPGLSLIAIHFNVNSPLADVTAGQYNADVNTKTGNEWVYENTDVVVNPGDVVNYWTLQVINGAGELLKEQSWTVPAPTANAPLTTKAATPQPTTQSPLVTSAAGVQITPQPISSGGQGVVHPIVANGNSGTTTVSNNEPAPLVSVNEGSGTSQTSMSTSSGSCGCTGSSIRPPGSEKTCTTFPCLIFEDEFNTLNLDVWEHEINLGGGGNWEFQQYTNNRTNSYVKDGKLFIKPSLTVDSLGEGPDGLMHSTLDVWGSEPGDVCTGNANYGCMRVGNPANILNPIQSARLRSSRGFNFKYGKVEIRAKMPKGDWLWPAIWLLPLRNAYGKWPASGEIDIVESRGNAHYTDDKGHEQGVGNAGSTLHFGSDFWHNKWESAHGEKLSSTGSYADDFHKYVLIWDEDHISISIDDTEVVNVTPQTSMWEYGGNDQDGVESPWVSGTKMAPFDQEFFLILNVAVGGTAFFPDKFVSPTGKPWTDASQHAPGEFWAAKNTWLPTWNLDQNNGEDAAMQVDYIKVWKLKP